MRLTRKFGTLFTLLAALSAATWSNGCGQKPAGKTNGKTPAAKQGHDDSKVGSGKKKKGTDAKKKGGPVIPGTVDDNPDGVGSGTGAGIKLDDLDNK